MFLVDTLQHHIGNETTIFIFWTWQRRHGTSSNQFYQPSCVIELFRWLWSCPKTGFWYLEGRVVQLNIRSTKYVYWILIHRCGRFHWLAVWCHNQGGIVAVHKWTKNFTLSGASARNIVPWSYYHWNTVSMTWAKHGKRSFSLPHCKLRQPTSWEVVLWTIIRTYWRWSGLSDKNLKSPSYSERLRAIWSWRESWKSKPRNRIESRWRGGQSNWGSKKSNFRGPNKAKYNISNCNRATHKF